MGNILSNILKINFDVDIFLYIMTSTDFLPNHPAATMLNKLILILNQRCNRDGVI